MRVSSTSPRQDPPSYTNYASDDQKTSYDQYNSQQPRTYPFKGMSFSPNPNHISPIGIGSNFYNPGSILQKFNGIPVNITCPCCSQNIITKIVRKPGKKTVVAVIFSAFIFWPLMWVPLLIKQLKDKHHTCPYCNVDLGKAIYIETAAPGSK
ncbi:Cell death-inducing p53-target protein 1 [Smittium culicis]|uniref:Cell death-inducing p53-target protein 1 n=1 Tax=Smittium culicis TaxID=133412 RepID=A0A1R1X8C1_9FUNG|nr:Cell death-inducing p53-target protein 1 [Smittium culicis]OMJ15434.1 Cell death-inducing p53-target protein 1 [Smittium culicis]OMJ18627.1 Cell death-inducing p53-target protein 1 [Smittium culicis]